MPTVLEWQQALSHEYQLSIESTAELCNEVWRRQQLRRRKRRASGRQPIASKNLIPWPPSGQRQTVLVRPIELLHHLGQITTPPITELVDLSSTWAEIRYVWAFRPNFDSRFKRSLRLNDAVKRLDFHQKTLLSDEFGIAFAAFYMDRFEKATDPIDAFVARRQGQIRLRGNSRRSLPDYIFTGPNPNQYYVVECKGTQSSRATVAQLQRGSEQVMTVDIDPPASITRLVIGSWLQQSIAVLLIDPEEELPDDGEIRKLSRWSQEEISAFAAAKRLTYVGDQLAASKVVTRFAKTEMEPPVFEEALLTNLETRRGNFVGSAQRRITPDGHRLEMFRGVRSDLLDALYHGRAPSKEFDVSGERTADTGYVETVTADDIAFVRSFTRDGSMFEVRILE